MWTSGNPGTSHYSSDDDDLMDLEFLSMSDEDEVEKIPQRTFMVTGQEWTKFLMTEHPQTIKDLLRVNQHTFRTLVDLLVAKGQLKWDHMRLLVEESLAIFLYICGQSEQHRVAAHWFQHSTDTISRHFKVMRRALCSVAPFVIRPPDLEVTPPEILNDGRYYPWFKDCVGAIDGTHIDAWASESREVAYRGRKSRKTQNVMAVCSFDMKFTYIFPGWEGSAHNGRVFLSVVTNLDYKFPNPPINKYYVVDAGYTNMPGYLAPYRGQRYHKEQWNGSNTVFESPQELFNYKHSSLRNVIERCFGVLKNRFPILKRMPKYPPARQPQIVTACCVVHNWIIIQRGRDEFFDGFNDDAEWEADGGHDNVDGVQANVEHVDMSAANIALMGIRRDEIAEQLWANY